MKGNLRCIMETPVFENENKRHIKCYIFDCEDYYELRTAGNTAKFSKSDSVLKAVINAIKQYGNPQSSPKYKIGFTFRGKEKPSRNYTHITHLSHVLMAAYSRKPVPYYQGRRLLYLDGNENNLTKENIRLASDCKTSVMEIDGAKYTAVMSGGALSITNYFEELHQIIDSLIWQYDKKSRAMRSKPFGMRGCYLHQLVWAYCSMAGVNADNWRDAVAQVYADKDSTIDHKKSWGSHLPRWDNRIENLQLVYKSINSTKGSCTKNIPPHCFYFPTTCGEIYGSYDYKNSTISVYRHSGQATEESVAALRYFCKIGKFQNDSGVKTYDINSPNGLALLLAELHQNKLYQEVFNKCLSQKK